MTAAMGKLLELYKPAGSRVGFGARLRSSSMPVTSTSSLLASTRRTSGRWRLHHMFKCISTSAFFKNVWGTLLIHYILAKSLQHKFGCMCMHSRFTTLSDAWQHMPVIMSLSLSTAPLQQHMWQ